MSVFAPEYTKREKVVWLVKVFSWVVPLFILTQYWFLPWFEGYVKKSHCFNYGSYTGTELVFYGIFVGFPVSLVIVLVALEGSKAISVFKIGQYPLPGEKVFKPTKYVYGFKARIRPLILLLLLGFLLGFSIWGYFSASEIIDMAHDMSLPSCADLVVLEASDIPKGSH